jgi:hypothetical protein
MAREAMSDAGLGAADADFAAVSVRGTARVGVSLRRATEGAPPKREALRPDSARRRAPLVGSFRGWRERDGKVAFMAWLRS